MKDIIDFNVCN